MPRGVPNVKPRKTVDTTNFQVGQPGVVTMDPVDADLKVPLVEVPGGPQSKTKLEELAFMDEKVLIEVHPTADPEEPQFVAVGVNGINQTIPKGIPIPVKRKYVEALCRMKKDSYRNEEYRDQDGNQNVRWPKTTGLRHPFSVIQDDNQRRGGPAWLRKVLAEA